MKLIRRILLVIPLVLPYMLLYAQTIKPLKIGDKVPDIYFAKMLNHTDTSGKLSDFKGKAIIIDMWFKECVACISAMPHLDSIQNEFKNDLKIMLVTWQKHEEIEKFWQRNLDVNKFKFTQVVEDIVTRKFFPAVSFPHQIWIDKTGTVVAITDGRSATLENINKLISGNDIGTKEKKDELDAKISWGREPLINIRYEENKSKILNYSYFSSYRNELNGSITHEIDTLNRLVRMKFSNLDYITLYDAAYKSDITVGSFNRATRLIRKDHKSLPLKLDFKEFTTSFCYDLIYKDSTKTVRHFGKRMIADLDNYFNVKSHEELRNIPCYVIRPNGKGTRYRQIIDLDGKKHLYNISLKTNKILSASKQLPSWIEYQINSYSKIPILFEFDDEKNLNFEVKWNLDDLEQMNKEFAKYDLKIEKAIRKRKVIILEDAK